MRFVNNVPNNTSNNETSHQSYISKIFVFKAFVRKLTKGFIYFLIFLSFKSISAEKTNNLRNIFFNIDIYKYQF